MSYNHRNRKEKQQDEETRSAESATQPWNSWKCGGGKQFSPSRSRGWISRACLPAWFCFLFLGSGRSPGRYCPEQTTHVQGTSATPRSQQQGAAWGMILPRTTDNSLRKPSNWGCVITSRRISSFSTSDNNTTFLPYHGGSTGCCHRQGLQCHSSRLGIPGGAPPFRHALEFSRETYQGKVTPSSSHSIHHSAASNRGLCRSHKHEAGPKRKRVREKIV
jgi:hypothetical protein